MNTQANRYEPGSERPASAAELRALLAGWADGDHGTLPQQLAHALRRAVVAGLLPDGARLPPERSLATQLAVSRSTVTAALDELRQEGLLVSRRGSGTVVRGTVVRALGGSRVAEHFAPTAGIDLAAGNPPDAAHLPPVHLDVAALLAGGAGPGVQPLGLPALRVALAERDVARGRITDVDQIHVTAGAHQAVALALGVAAGPGTAVAVEDPSYPGVFDVLDGLGARPVPVRCDGGGLDPAVLDRVLTEHQPPVVYLQTGPHNPTGVLPSRERLRALAQVLDRHEVTVVEDGALAELAFSGPVETQLVDLCRRAAVVTLGSFSKVAWGGLRLGWLRGPAPFVARTMHLRLASDLGPAVPSQLLALQLLPGFEELAARRRADLADAVERAIGRLHDELPEWRVQRPAGGSVLWPELPVPDTGAYVLLARRHGVHVTPGSIATPGRGDSPYLRICIDRPPAMVDEGIRRLRLAWRELDTLPRSVLG